MGALTTDVRGANVLMSKNVLRGTNARTNVLGEPLTNVPVETDLLEIPDQCDNSSPSLYELERVVIDGIVMHLICCQKFCT